MGVGSPLRAHLAMSRDIFGCLGMGAGGPGQVLLLHLAGRERPGMLPNTLKCAGHSLTAQNVNSTECEKSQFEDEVSPTKLNIQERRGGRSRSSACMHVTPSQIDSEN